MSSIPVSTTFSKKLMLQGEISLGPSSALAFSYLTRFLPFSSTADPGPRLRRILTLINLTKRVCKVIIRIHMIVLLYFPKAMTLLGEFTRWSLSGPQGANN